MSKAYSSRVRAFRESILKTLPRVPNNGLSLAALRALPTRRLILAFLTWRMRLIPAKPRVVRIWSGGIKPFEFEAAAPLLKPLLDKVKLGADLTPHLSLLVGNTGAVLPGASPEYKGKRSRP